MTNFSSPVALKNIDQPASWQVACTSEKLDMFCYFKWNLIVCRGDNSGIFNGPLTLILSSELLVQAVGKSPLVAATYAEHAGR